jgi:SAM-dependent methyltransferase
MNAQLWFEDEDFWNATYDFMFSESNFGAAVADVPKVIALSGRTDGAVLDMCCGPGRYSVPFAKQGFAVTGVDRTAFLLNKARAYAEQEGVNVTWVHSDMRHFVEPGKFNLALNLYTSFGFFDDIDENRAVLRNLYASLTTSGVLVMEMASKERLAKIFQPTGSNALPNGDVLFERRFIADGWEQIENEWTIVSGGRAKTYRLRFWLFTGRELKDLLYSAGFQHVKVYGDFDGAAYGVNASRLVAVARK